MIKQSPNCIQYFWKNYHFFLSLVDEWCSGCMGQACIGEETTTNHSECSSRNIQSHLTKKSRPTEKMLLENKINLADANPISFCFMQLYYSVRGDVVLLMVPYRRAQTVLLVDCIINATLLVDLEL